MYTENGWTRVCNRLESARESYDTVSKLEKKARKEGDIDSAIISCWSFGEYAVNVLLEFEGLKNPEDHSQPDRAQALFTAGKLARDYSSVLKDQERFRKKASHLDYARNKRVKYGDVELLACLTAMESLRVEVDAAINQRKKTP